MRLTTALLVFAVLALAGCSAPELSSAPAPVNTVSSDPLNRYLDSVRAFVKCMRDEKIAITDPDAKGNTALIGDPATLKGDPRTGAAHRKCQPLLAAAPEEFSRPTDQEFQWSLNYAKCMRENGVAHYPDPNRNGEPSRPDSHAPEPSRDVVERALDKCKPVQTGGQAR